MEQLELNKQVEVLSKVLRCSKRSWTIEIQKVTFYLLILRMSEVLFLSV